MRWIAALLLALALAGCTAEPRIGPSLETTVAEEIGELPGVESASISADEPHRIDVVVLPDVTTEQLVTIAGATRELAVRLGESEPIVAALRMEPGPVDPETDIAPLPALQLDLYPSLRTTASEDARQLMAARSIAEVETVGIIQNQVRVSVASADGLAGALDDLRDLDLWSAGGHLSAENGRVRINDVPERLTTDGMRLILESAVAYPTAQFWLEAPNDNFRVQRLYVDQVDEAQAEQIADTLADPSLPAPTEEGIELYFVVSWVGAGGRVDIDGYLGASRSVPAEPI